MTPEEFWKILHDISEPQPVFFRLYYDARNGRPLSYSMEDLPGTYITIDADTYRRSSFAVRVRVHRRWACRIGCRSYARGRCRVQ